MHVQDRQRNDILAMVKGPKKRYSEVMKSILSPEDLEGKEEESDGLVKQHEVPQQLRTAVHSAHKECRPLMSSHHCC